jgi:hypothetical protein
MSWPLRCCLVKAPGERAEPGAVPVVDGVPQSHVGHYRRAPGALGVTLVRGFGAPYDGACTVWAFVPERPPLGDPSGHSILLPIR